MINDGVPQKTKEWFLEQSIEACLECLTFCEYFEVAAVLKEIKEKRPRVYVVHNWPETLLVHSEKGELDIMVYVNGLISSVNCELVVE
ncbi:MAG: hypothetical protein PHF86_09445 [Candidatus Nanoarchaeia archaeon]|nr:hypothetical protein [Candidatus Nanoarchaeia archaeon]